MGVSMPSARHPFPEPRLQAHVAHLTVLPVPETQGPTSIPGQTNCNGFPCPWQDPPSYVVGAHTAKAVSTWSLPTLENVINGNMALTVRARGDTFEDVTPETLDLACQEWYSRYYGHPEYTKEDQAQDTAGQQGVIDEFLLVRATNIPRPDNGKYRYCAVPAPWLPLFRHPHDPDAPQVYYLCYQCLKPYTNGGHNDTCDTCIAAGLQRAEDAGRPAYLPDFVSHRGKRYRRLGDNKLGCTTVRPRPQPPANRSPTFEHSNMYTPLGAETSIDEISDSPDAYGSGFDVRDAFLHSEPFSESKKPKYRTAEVLPTSETTSAYLVRTRADCRAADSKVGAVQTARIDNVTDVPESPADDEGTWE